MEPGFVVMGRLHRARWGHRIERFADGELAEPRADAVRRHLAVCRDCVGHLDFLRCVKASLARLGSS